MRRFVYVVGVQGDGNVSYYSNARAAVRHLLEEGTWYRIPSESSLAAELTEGHAVEDDREDFYAFPIELESRYVGP